MQKDYVILTSLSTGNQVMTFNNRWNCIGLNWGGDLIASKLNVSQHRRVKTSLGKCLDRLDTNSTLLNNLKASNPIRLLAGDQV